MKKLVFLFALLFALLFGLAVSKDYFKNGKFIFGEKTSTATINNHTFKLLVAKTSEEKEVGLSKRKSLDKNYGMLFVFDHPDYYSFWARDMQIPIDIIFIKENRIVTIFQDVQPPKASNDNLPIFRSAEPSDQILEINAGLSKEYEFNQGDTVRVENLK